MAWKIELTKAAEKELDKLDPQIAKRILMFLYDRVAPLDDPRSIGDSLTGSKLGEFWKYRVGSYRVVADIQDAKLQILIVRIGNRGKVYRK
jgi:mRNA interferase RelE/StbE